jgi:hypothetical protein
MFPNLGNKGANTNTDGEASYKEVGRRGALVCIMYYFTVARTAFFPGLNLIKVPSTKTVQFTKNDNHFPSCHSNSHRYE